MVTQVTEQDMSLSYNEVSEWCKRRYAWGDSQSWTSILLRIQEALYKPTYVARMWRGQLTEAIAAGALPALLESWSKQT